MSADGPREAFARCHCLIIAGLAVASTAADSPAGATTRTRGGIWFSLPNHATSWNGRYATIHANAHIVHGVHKAITGREVVAFKNGHWWAKGAPMSIPAGQWTVDMIIHYRTYRLGTRTVRIWRAGDYPNHTHCLITAVDSDGFVTGTKCTNARYPGQVVADKCGCDMNSNKFSGWKVGQVYNSNLVWFKGQHVKVQRYGRIYTGRAKFTTNRFPLSVRAAWRYCGAPANPWHYNYCGNGSLIYSPASSVCSYFACIDNFWNGYGYMTECWDGMVSMSGGISGACSDHGGEWRPVHH